MRFEYPSRLDDDCRAVAGRRAPRGGGAIGFSHGLFNVELFYQPQSGRITIIEINPRMAGQFSDLYERRRQEPVVASSTSHSARPCVPASTSSRFGSAARYFVNSATPSSMPPGGPETLADGTTRRPTLSGPQHSSVTGAGFTKWLGNYRSALIHMGGRDHDDMMARFADVCQASGL